MAIINDYLEINCYEYQTNKNNEFFSQYSHEQIKQFSPMFSLANSIYDDFIIFKKAVESKNVRINKNQKNELYITFALEEEEYENQNINIPLEFNTNFDNSYIEYYPAKRLPTIHVKMKTINIRRPTIYINGDSSEITQYPINNNLFYSQQIGPNLPIINNNNIIRNKTYTQVNKNMYSSPQKVNNNIRYYSPLNSPEREKIEYINNGSPSKNQYNYTSYKRNIISKSSPLKNNNVNMNNSFSADFSTSLSSEYEEKIKELGNELDKRKKIAEEQNLKMNKLLNIMQIQKAEIEKLKKNETEILLQNQNKEYNNDLIKKQFIDEKNKIQNEFELYKKQKEEEITSLKSQIEQLNKQIIICQSENKQMKLKFEEERKSKLIYQRKTKLRIVKGEIIQNNKELEFLTQRISKDHKKITLNLLYKATVDSDKAEVFHRKCDSSPSSLVLVKSKNDKRFGGFTTCSWAGDGIDKQDENAFVFSLDKMKIYDIIPEEYAIGCYPKYGPIFLGCQIRIFDNAFEKGGTTFEKGRNYNTAEDYELTGGLQKFEVEEIEVYGVEVE